VAQVSERDLLSVGLLFPQALFAIEVPLLVR
jgi:hypothetical protein